MMSRSVPSTGSELGTVIGTDTLIKGDIMVPHSMRLDGRVQGKVEVNDTLTVGPNGVVEGSVQVRSVMIGGKVVGSVTASDKITLNGTAVMNGDLMCTKLVIEEGATFDGMSKMRGDKLPLMMPQSEPQPSGAAATPIRPTTGPVPPQNTGPKGKSGGDDEIPRWADRGR